MFEPKFNYTNKIVDNLVGCRFLNFRMFKITRQAVNKEIKKLIMLEVIEKKGVGKKIFYILK